MRQGKGAVDGVLLEEAVHQFLRVGAVDRVQHSSSKEQLIESKELTRFNVD
jgi:hypothetical protein